MVSQGEKDTQNQTAPISRREYARLWDRGPCPESINGHDADSPSGRCIWCAVKAGPSDRQHRAHEQWLRDRALVWEDRRPTVDGAS